MMNPTTIIPIIMAGGTGSRLWPLSRELYPKQYLRLMGNLSMLQMTISRLKNITSEPPIVICNEEHRFIVAEQLREIDKLENNIILEPVGRNTAPAIALAANFAEKNYPNQKKLLLVLPADHLIKDQETFVTAVNNALDHAKAGKLVTFGIIADKPETGYGYIKRQDTSTSSEGDCVFPVESFVEKPDYGTACEYVESGEYYWNSGMFLFRSDTYLNELKKYRDDIYQACLLSVENIDADLDFIRINKEQFQQCPSESIDYAVMEKTCDAVVVPMNAGWSDVGSWSSLWDVSEKDESGNAFTGDVISFNTENSYIFNDSGLVTTVGVKDIVIVQTKDALLVADRHSVQDVKKIVEQIKNNNRLEHYTHREVYRPWGKYDSVDAGERYQVKRITVKPGEGMSLQMHHHRAEHWIVVAGTAKVSVNGESKLLTENESIYIPLGATHCLENPGKIPLDIIEVRSGAYLSEDDIVRLADRYGRI